MLEDQASFAKRDFELFRTTFAAYRSGDVSSDLKLNYSLSLPSIPKGHIWMLTITERRYRVQVFAVAYWSNTWRDPFLEPRDGRAGPAHTPRPSPIQEQE
jgi:hypothetical protein